MVTGFEGITWTLFIGDSVSTFLHSLWRFIQKCGAVVKQPNASVGLFMQSCSHKLVYAKKKRPLGLRPDLIVCPAGLPHAQSLGVGELSFEAEQDPAVAEEQLEAVLPQSGQVLVEAGQHETQQLPQVHLGSGAERVHTALTKQRFHTHIFIFFGWNYASPGCTLLNVHRCFIL